MQKPNAIITIEHSEIISEDEDKLSIEDIMNSVALIKSKFPDANTSEMYIVSHTTYDYDESGFSIEFEREIINPHYHAECIEYEKYEQNLKIAEQNRKDEAEKYKISILAKKEYRDKRRQERVNANKSIEINGKRFALVPIEDK